MGTAERTAAPGATASAGSRRPERGGRAGHTGPVLLTVSTTMPRATDLGHLLHEHPDRAQSTEVAVGTAHVLWPEATEERATAALLLEVDPVALVRGRPSSCRGAPRPRTSCATSTPPSAPPPALLTRTSARSANAEAFTAAHRRYVWPTRGLDGVELAPFQLLAPEGRTWGSAHHGWHLALADRLVAVAPQLVRPTRRLAVETGEPASVETGVRWWEELTAAGGEGMVVKPFAGVVATDRGLPQPGLEVRGREYLRLVYGPDHTEPENLARLRERHLGLKRS